jgi:hypothetical protein
MEKWGQREYMNINMTQTRTLTLYMTDPSTRQEGLPTT